MMTAIKSACQSEAEFWSALTQVSSAAPVSAASSDAEEPVKPKKSKKASDAAPKEKKEPTDWNKLVTQTVSEMKQSGWESWTDLKGTVWPASLSVVLKDKKGVESEQFVYSCGEHEGKQPSPALGGMVRASYLKAKSDPEHAAKVAKKAEKSSAAASVASEGSDAEAVPVAVKKGGRPPMTDEQKTAAKLKRAIKKAADAEAASAPIALRGEWAELEDQKEKEE